MKIVIIAAAVLIGFSCADARASDNGAATGTDSASVGGLKKPPLRSGRGIELRAWAPVAPPYNAEANEDLAGRNIWGAYRDPLALPKINPAGSSGTTKRHDLPMRAIVNGHHVQPRRDLLDALGYSDLSPQAAEEVDRLNRQLLQKNLVANRMHS